MRVRWILLAAFVAALLSGAVVYPIYPSQQSICDIMAERSRNEDRSASPHRGAVVTLHGELYGLPLAGGHQYAFRTRCGRYDYFLAIDGTGKLGSTGLLQPADGADRAGDAGAGRRQGRQTRASNRALNA